MTVSDGTNTASDSFLLTVNAVNTPPTITIIANQSVNEDTATAGLSFTIGTGKRSGQPDPGQEFLQPTLVPLSGIVFGGSGANRTVTVTPATNQSGSATITVSVTDGQYAASNSFVVTVNAVNDAPTITGIVTQTVNVNGTTGPLNFTIGDVDTALTSLTLNTSSSNPTLVPAGGVFLGGSGANRTVTVTPAAGQTGSSTITLGVSDGLASASTDISR